MVPVPFAVRIVKKSLQNGKPQAGFLRSFRDGLRAAIIWIAPPHEWDMTQNKTAVTPNS